MLKPGKKLISLRLNVVSPIKISSLLLLTVISLAAILAASCTGTGGATPTGTPGPAGTGASPVTSSDADAAIVAMGTGMLQLIVPGLPDTGIFPGLTSIIVS
jgi:hypothetical protein